MRVDNRLTAALALSLLMHILIVGSPGWRLPLPDAPVAGGVLEAHLAPQPAPVLPQPAPAMRAPATAPAPQPKARSHPPQQAPLPPPEAPPATAAAPLPEPAPRVEAAPVAPVAPQAGIGWPRQGRIRFVVTRGEGEQGMQIGESTHTWQHDGGRYAMQAVTETSGLVALFRALRIVQSSEGAIGAEGLVPHVFAVERQGRLAEGVRFDWTSGRAMLMRGGQPRREVTVVPGAQDVLSQIYQIGLAGVAARLEMMIATGKNYGRYAYEAVGDETLATPFGALRTWHVRTPALPGEQAMEVWLAQDHGNLPVRIRFVDRAGEVYDQNAVEFEIDGTRLAAQEK